MPLTRRLILQKARHHPTKRALTDCKHTVSGTISLPSRGTFHHSLTVLIRYRSQYKYSGLPGGPGRFTADSTSPLLLGDTHQHQPRMFSRTGLSPSTAGHSKPLPLTHATSARHGSTAQQGPTTPHTQPLPGITRIWFSHIIHVRSPLLAESLLFSSPTGTEMFHFPAFPPHRLLHSSAGDYTSLQPGFPIRTPSDQRSIGNSPRPIAALHVLHRLTVPRHPPCALKNKQHNTTHHTTQQPLTTQHTQNVHITSKQHHIA